MAIMPRPALKPGMTGASIEGLDVVNGRWRIKRKASFEERLAAATQCLNERAIPNGSDRELILRRAQQIETASVTMRDGGNAPTAAYYEQKLSEAQALLKRMTERGKVKNR